MKFYHWTLPGRKPIRGTGEPPDVGVWERVEGALRLCDNGLHALTADEVPNFCGQELWECEVRGDSLADQEKACWRERRDTRQLRWSSADMIEYAKWSAAQATVCAGGADDVKAAGRFAEAAARADAAKDDGAAARYARTTAYYTAAANAFAAFYTAPPYNAADAATEGLAARDPLGAAADAHKHARLAQRAWIEARIGEKL